jgi:hypothetical protein
LPEEGGRGVIFNDEFLIFNGTPAGSETLVIKNGAAQHKRDWHFPLKIKNYPIKN